MHIKDESSLVSKVGKSFSYDAEKATLTRLLGILLTLLLVSLVLLVVLLAPSLVLAMLVLALLSGVLLRTLVIEHVIDTIDKKTGIW